MDNQIIITDEYKKYFRAIEKGKNRFYFLTGNAGVGKSTFLKYFLEKTELNTVLLAPTGIAALNIGGQTIHSFFKLPITLLVKEYFKVFYNSQLANDLLKVDLIIIDEVGMVRADVMDVIDRILRRHKNKNKMFGGVKILGIGDLFQLPPIIGRGDKKEFVKYYKGKYFFNSNVLSKAKIKVLNLTKVFRQKNEYFIDFLNKMRIGSSDYKLESINKRFKIKEKYIPYNFEGVVLCAYNRIAEGINKRKLSTIKNRKTGEFVASVSGSFPKTQYPVNYFLELKEGAKVIFCKNSSEFRNGETGYISKINPRSVKVIKDIDKSEVSVFYETWESTAYEDGNAVVVGRFSQIPLKLGWAISIHKSQGMTFDIPVIIHSGYGAFAAGQMYVAFSRISDPKNLQIVNELKEKDIFADSDVLEFMKQNKAISING